LGADACIPHPRLEARRLHSLSAAAISRSSSTSSIKNSCSAYESLSPGHVSQINEYLQARDANTNGTPHPELTSRMLDPATTAVGTCDHSLLDIIWRVRSRLRVAHADEPPASAALVRLPDCLRRHPAARLDRLEQRRQGCARRAAAHGASPAVVVTIVGDGVI
jgi:hypothetical protein